MSEVPCQTSTRSKSEPLSCAFPPTGASAPLTVAACAVAFWKKRRNGCGTSMAEDRDMAIIRRSTAEDAAIQTRCGIAMLATLRMGVRKEECSVRLEVRDYVVDGVAFRVSAPWTSETRPMLTAGTTMRTTTWRTHFIWTTDIYSHSVGIGKEICDHERCCERKSDSTVVGLPNLCYRDATR